MRRRANSAGRRRSASSASLAPANRASRSAARPRAVLKAAGPGPPGGLAVAAFPLPARERIADAVGLAARGKDLRPERFRAFAASFRVRAQLRRVRGAAGRRAEVREPDFGRRTRLSGAVERFLHTGDPRLREAAPTVGRSGGGLKTRGLRLPFPTNRTDLVKSAGGARRLLGAASMVDLCACRGFVGGG